MIAVERNQRVVHLEIDAPPVNVIDGAILTELVAHLDELEGDESIAAVIMRGKGRCFSAGASVAEHAEEQAAGMLTALSKACLALADFPAPVVATVHGVCLGGAMELISFCDFVVAAPDAVFGQPEIKLAFFPPVAMHRLTRLTGYQNAAYAILTGENLPADRALAMGLAQKLLPRESWAEIDDIFNCLSAPVLRISKRALAANGRSESERQLDHFKDLFMSELYRLEDVSEGIRSFEDRRAPEWKHR